MKEELLELEKTALKELKGVKDPRALEKFRVTYLGKKGLLTSFMKNLGELPPDKRPEVGKLANRIKDDLNELIKKWGVWDLPAPAKGIVDITLPGRKPLRGHLHPITIVIKEVCQIFSRMGFSVVKGPNIELDY